MLEIIELSNPKINLYSKYIKGDNGLIETIKAIHSTKDLVRAIPAVPILARTLNPENEELAEEWYDLNAEILRIIADKPFKIAEGKQMPEGKYIIYNVGCSTFSHDINKMELFVNRIGKLNSETCVGLNDNYSIPLSKNQINCLLGDKVTNIVDAYGKVQEQNAEIWTFNQFNEAQKNKKFLLNNPFYTVLFPIDEASAMNHGYEAINSDSVIKHKPSRVLAGGDNIWKKFLDVSQNKGRYSMFHVGVPNLAPNRGGIISLNTDYEGFDCNAMVDDRQSLGIAPNALEKLLNTFYESK